MNQKRCCEIAIVAVLVLDLAVMAQPPLTIYNQDFAVVRQPLSLDLQRGANEVRVTDITAHMEADSVILRDPAGKRAIQILEQNYRADPISQGLLLSLYEGKEIQFLVRKQDTDEIVSGRIIRSGYVPHQSGMQRYGQQYAMQQRAYAYGEAGQPIIEVDGKLRFSLPGEPLFPALTDDTILKPTLHWVLETDKAGKLDAELSYVTGGMSWEADYGTQSNPKVWVMREFKNSKENHLGVPLPRGRMRFYRRDDDGQLEFTGENLIDHTPRDETVRVYTGDAFDLVGERRRTDYRIDTERHWLDESFEIKVRNRKEQGAVEIRVVEHLYRWVNWEIVEKSDPFVKTDSQMIEFRIQVPAGKEKVATYKVHYTW
jgi:hypothetical protein